MFFVEKLSAIVLNILLYLTALVPLSRSQPLLTLLFRLTWLGFLGSMIFFLFYWRVSGADTSISGLVGTTLFVCNALADIVTMIEVILKSSTSNEIIRLEHEVDQLMESHLQVHYKSVMGSKMLLLLAVQFTCDGLKIWINARKRFSPVFWHGYPILQGLRMRYVQLIMLVLSLNQRLELLKQALLSLASHNKLKSDIQTEVWRPYSIWEFERLNAMRLIYGRIHELYGTLDECFGWSILAIFMSSFIDFVCNAYWSFRAVYKRQGFERFVMNGSTSLSLGTLVVVLFYYTEESFLRGTAKAYFSPIKEQFSKALHRQIKRNSTMEGFQHCITKASLRLTWKIRFGLVVHFIFHLGLWFFAILPYTQNTYLNEFYKLCWFVEIVVVVFNAFYPYEEKVPTEYSLGGLVSSMLFLTQAFAHLTILWDIFSMRHKRQSIWEKSQSLDKRFIESKLEVPIDMGECYWKHSLLLINVILQLTIWHAIIGWTTFKVNATATSLYWHGLLSSLALQFRILEFLFWIVLMNSRLLVLRLNINVIGERNLERIFKSPMMTQRKRKNGRFLLVSPLSDEEEDERLLVVLKSLHNDIFVVFQIINDSYGWSLLAFTALYFIDFVTNSYWVVLAMITQGRDNLAFLQNGGFLWIVIVMLSMVCWHCQKSYDYSRQIGCLIFKLVKPMGNKRYNDLVNEFSLQTMHQQFVITAKEFFSLNLNLLGSMVAAIVTYLVILIQFMFTEKSNLENSMTTTMATFTKENSSLILANYSKV